MNSDKKTKMIALGVMGLVVIIGGVLGWYFEANLLSVENQKLEEKKSEVTDVKGKVAKIKKLKEEKDQKAEEAAMEVAKIPDLSYKEYDTFVDEVDKLARQSGVLMITNTAFQKEKKKAVARGAQIKTIPEDVDHVDYEIVCQGTWYPLLRMINLLETESRFIKVKTCLIKEIDTPKTGLTGLIREMTVTVTAYTFKTQVPTAKKITRTRPGSKPGKSDKDKDAEAQEVNLKKSTELPE